MSLLAVQGGATGTGTVTLLAPVTNTNRTLTLPDETGTLITAASNTYIGGRGQVFTTTGDFTVPAGITAVKVTVIGGGGNGASVTTTGLEGGGGGAGGTAIEFITGLTPGDLITVTVGAVANTSSFGAFCSATGGASVSLNGTAGGAGGVGSGGDINLTGGAGGTGSGNNVGGGGGGGTLSAATPGFGFTITCNDYVGSISLGGVGMFGAGGNGRAITSSGGFNGIAATGFGNGGSGGATGGTADATGGAGSAGIVIVEF